MRIGFYKSEKWLKNTYGITEVEHENMLELQQYLCAICKKELYPRRDTHIDHCHTTGKVRGILCSKCNTGLGMFNDSIETLLNATDYLVMNVGI